MENRFLVHVKTFLKSYLRNRMINVEPRLERISLGQAKNEVHL
jgi:hypothetical protein